MNRKTNEWGSDLIRTRISRESYIFQKRSWHDLKITEWIFIFFAISSILVSIGFSSYQLAMSIIEKDKQFIFPVLTILNNVFSVYFLWNGVMEELPFNLLVQLGVKTLIWIFDLIFFLISSKDAGKGEDSEERNEIRAIRFYISSAMLCVTLLSGGIVIYEYWSSKIAIFRTVGTEPKFVRLCRLWNFCHSMILFDAVLFITVIFHICNYPYFIGNNSVYYLLPLWILAMMVYATLGIRAVDQESRLLTYVFYVLSHSQPIFIIFLLAKATQSGLGLLLYISLFVTSILALLVHIGLLISVVLLQNSYGLGLKQAAAREEERKQLMTSHSNAKYEDVATNMKPRTKLPPTETEL